MVADREAMVPLDPLEPLKLQKLEAAPRRCRGARSDVSPRRTSGDAILGSGHAGGRLDAVTSLETLRAPLQP